MFFLSLSPKIQALTYFPHRNTNRQTNRQRDRETERQSNKQTDKHTNRQTGKQINSNKRVKIKILKFNKGKFNASEEIWVFMICFSFPNIQTLTHFAHHNTFLL